MDEFYNHKIDQIYQVEEIPPKQMKYLIEKFRSKKNFNELGTNWNKRHRYMLDQFNKKINLPMIGDII